MDLDVDGGILGTQEASEPEPVEPDSDSESFRYFQPPCTVSYFCSRIYYFHIRAALESSTLAYLSSHFHDGVASVFSVRAVPNQFVVQIVANKYNPSNFWYVRVFRCRGLLSAVVRRSGRWRSEYVVDLSANKVHGRILVNVHYYEQGNVGLQNSFDDIRLTPSRSS